MSDFTLKDALAAKSDQLNAMDIVGCEPVIRVRDVVVRKGDQPLSVYFDGDNNKPWKPSKGMGRILMFAWGENEKEWIGKYAQLFFEPSVKFGGEAVGGIRIKALSDIDKRGILLALTISRQKREPYKVEHLQIETAEYPSDRFAKALPVMAEKMRNGEMTLQQVIAQCQKTGQLTAEQLAQLEQAAPVEIHDDEDEVM